MSEILSQNPSHSFSLGRKKRLHVNTNRSFCHKLQTRMTTPQLGDYPGTRTLLALVQSYHHESLSLHSPDHRYQDGVSRSLIRNGSSTHTSARNTLLYPRVNALQSTRMNVFLTHPELITITLPFLNSPLLIRVQQLTWARSISLH